MRSTGMRYLTREACEALFGRITTLCPRGDTSVTIASTWRGTTRWARNAIISSSDRTDQTVTITRDVYGVRGTASTNQVDDASLRAAVAAAERQLRLQPEDLDAELISGPRPHTRPDIFKQPTYDLLAPARSAIARDLVGPALTKDLLTAGYLEAAARALGVFDTKGLASYYVATDAQYSVTVRNRAGNASGWAGASHADWAKLDAAAVSARALEKCVTSQDPVRVEPGRYTTVLEPQAVYDLMRLALTEALMARNTNERYDTQPFNLRKKPRRGSGYGVAKFGLQLLDERISVSTDPEDPETGYIPFNEKGEPYRKATWVEAGVLRELPYDLLYALETLVESASLPYTPAFRMTGGDTPLEAMIASTPRGVLVTRFMSTSRLDDRSVASTGVTSDGTWLIEDGKIKAPIVNLRFNASPLLAFRVVDQIGVPQRVFAPGAPASVPPIKVRDFDFSGLADAV